MSLAADIAPGPDRMLPGLEIADPGTAWWVGQVMLRLRREVTWLRHLGRQTPAQAALDLVRHHRAKADFLATDPAGRFLGARLGGAPPEPGRFGRLSNLAGLSTAGRFALALALASRLDCTLGPVLALCNGDRGRPWPTLGLAQQLWDDPLEMLEASDPDGPLLGLRLARADAATDPLEVPARLARYLAGEALDRLVLSLRAADRAASVAGARFGAAPQALEIVALVGPPKADIRRLLAAMAGRPVLASRSLDGMVGLALTEGADLWLDRPLAQAEEAAIAVGEIPAMRRVGVRVFLHVTGREVLRPVPPQLLGPVLTVPPADVEARAHALRAAFPDTRPEALDRIAREFRLETAEIVRVGGGAGPAEPARIRHALRAELSLDFEGLAEPVTPRYSRADIVLPPAIDRHFDEAIAAVRGSGRLLHEWGGGRFGDGGVSLLFAGPPGTGKTMAAEVMSRELDLPLFRIDLSQVVNKYIGETEKNLKRVFDAAERMRSILFFDEAEALFGKRSEVKEANDRFANIETGYLLQRMDSFAGISVLATNRRRDLDDAFARRLRYVIEFPVPGEVERRRIWDTVFPDPIDRSDLDIAFLARRFQVSGGHIRSIALNAALQAAARGPEAAVTMRDVLIATRRELDKLNRKSGPEAFGPYHDAIEELRE